MNISFANSVEEPFEAPHDTYMAQNLHHFPPLGICYLLYGIGNSW